MASCISGSPLPPLSPPPTEGRRQASTGTGGRQGLRGVAVRAWGALRDLPLRSSSSPRQPPFCWGRALSRAQRLVHFPVQRVLRLAQLPERGADALLPRHRVAQTTCSSSSTRAHTPTHLWQGTDSHKPLLGRTRVEAQAQADPGALARAGSEEGWRVWGLGST